MKMMYWFDGSWGWGGWLLMALSMTAFWCLLVWLAVTLTRSIRPPTPRDRPDPAALLAERFARGEIDEHEYRRRLEVLQNPHSAAHS
jgi:putative membrane protein